MKTAKLQELIEDTPTQIREEINLINAQNNKMKIELVQKDNTIKKLKNDLEKARKNALFKTARTEILVTEPTKTNVEINHELLNTKTILTKVSAMHAAEKKRANKLDKEVKTLQDEVAKLRKTAIDLRDEFNSKMKETGGKKGDNKNMIENNFPLNIKGFNFLVDKNEEENDDEEEEEEQESEGSSEEEDSYEGKKKPKSKQKELELLTDQYNKLKKQNEEYEKKINNYKKIYKDLKNKINNLKQMPNSNERSQRKFGNNGIEPTTDDTNSRPNA